MNRTAFAVTVATAAITATAGCASTITKAAPTQPPAAQQTACAPPDDCGTTDTPTPGPTESTLDGPVGTTYTVTGDNGPNGSTTTYSVTMTRVDQHATLDQYGSLTNGSDHVTAAEFRIEGSSGQASDDADNDAVAVGTDGQDYTPAFDTITEGTNFDGGDFRVSPGRHVTGWISFELPAGVSIASVQWAPTFGGQSATWTVSS